MRGLREENASSELVALLSRYKEEFMTDREVVPQV